jgi:hypothetical protein
MAQDEEPQFSADLTVLISNAELDRLIAELATHPLAEGEARPVAGGVYVSLSQSQPAGLDYALPELGRRMYFFFRKPRDLPLSRSVP